MLFYFFKFNSNLLYRIVFYINNNQFNLKTMIKKIKQITQFIALCSLIILVGCETEKEFINEKNNVHKVNLKDLPFLQESINREKSKSSNAKNSAESYFDKIVPENIIEITDQQGLKNYTFALNFREQDTLINLNAKETTDGYTYSLIKYTTSNLDQWIYDILENNQSSITPEISTESLDSKTAYSVNCIQVTLTCPSGMHDGSNMGACNFSYDQWLLTIDVTNCPGGGGGYDTDIGEGIPTGDNNNPVNTSGSGGGGGGSGPIITSPNIALDTPCKRLKRLSDATNQNIAASIQTLKDKVNANTAIEWGFNFGKVSPIGISYTFSQDIADNLFTYNNVMVQGTANSVDMLFGENYIGSAHCHTLNGMNLFSWKDVFNLSLTYNATTTNKKRDAVMILVCNNAYSANAPNVYAIKVDNIATLGAKLAADLANSKYAAATQEEIIDNIHKEMSKTFLNPNAEKDFLNKFSSYGISLYRANETLDDWSKLTLEPGYIGGIKLTPCAFQ